MPESVAGAPASPAEQRQKLRQAARALIDALEQGKPAPGDALPTAKQLRETREFDLLDQLTDQMRRDGDERMEVRLLQAQSRIDQGRATSALDILEGSAARLEAGSYAWGETHGLMGRAWKQIFLDTDDKASPRARKALGHAVRQYAIPYELRKIPWHGLNLLALAHYARAKGLPIDPPIDPERLAREIIAGLGAEAKRDPWHFASLAEAHLALGALDSVEACIRTYVSDADTSAFALGGTLRQFTELWLLDQKGEREHGILQALRAALMRKDGGVMELTPEQHQRALGETASEQQLERILGDDAPVAVEWLELLLQRARSVAAIYRGPFRRVGTGFLIRGADFKAEWGDALFVLTNAHVVSENPADNAVDPREARIKLERADAGRSYKVERVVWSSPVVKLDATILKLTETVSGVDPLQATDVLPALDGKQRVYVIGHTGGGTLKVSFQDNILLDHEGPTAGTPVDPLVCHLHYRAPTEPGNSGSPVFNATSLEVIALHHAGGTDIRRLNGKAEKWPANEGIWIKSIIDAINRPP